MTEPAVRFETLVELYHDEIHAYLWRLLRNAGRPAAEAEDLTQDVFLRAYRAFRRLVAGSNHGAWLYKIATNCAYTALKQKRSVPLDDETRLEAQAPSLDQQMVANEALEQVARAIGGLPPKQRVAVVLRYVQELDYGSIAQALDCSPDSARANVYQALRRLRQELVKEPEQ